MIIFIYDISTIKKVSLLPERCPSSGFDVERFFIRFKKEIIKNLKEVVLISV